MKENKMLCDRVMLGNFMWVNISESMLVKDPCGTVEILSTYVRFSLHTFLTTYELQMISFDC